jgi:hypothetical protein
MTMIHTQDTHMWYISFQGEADGGVNNILVYHDSGQEHSQPELLPTGGSNPVLNELRGFALVGSDLYVVNAHKSISQILLYSGSESGGYTFSRVFASMADVSGIVHPFDLTFDAQGSCYISSQDTNVVTGVASTGTPLTVASWIAMHYPGSFYGGTIVASSVGQLPDAPAPYPPDVPAPQGLGVSFAGGPGSKVAHSVRGVTIVGSTLYVADEPGDAVKAYSLPTGQLVGTISGSNLSAPVHLLAQNGMLYIGSSGNDSVVTCDITSGPPSGTVAPTTFIDGDVKHISGFSFGGDGDFYAAERKAKKIKRFDATGKKLGTFIDNLPDEPEFILYVPKGS